CRTVLVVAAEKATQLAPQEDYKRCNLFGDGASAFVMTASRQADGDQFLFFDQCTDPEGLAYIRQTENGFDQDGPRVHKYVGSVVPARLADILRRLDLDAAEVDHFIPHQPSGKTIDLLEDRLRRLCPSLRTGIVRRHVATMGNMSCASTGHLLSSLVHEGVAESGDICLVYSFGSGMSFGGYGLRMFRD
ncbi:MAG TPA: 3-oxoacyl-[acyl-carrier-protein] synthase III C-terminal domain-containing protein, partial [Candidatus Saccharimonadales bacterium]|nr:3-oxoacyl-[acyl-carrier-protein] synthase III C-terminal domain-containing protein [Candidatus Saccharimonadales bacterium]